MSTVPRVACGDAGEIVPCLPGGDGRVGGLRDVTLAGAVISPSESGAWCILGGLLKDVSRGSVCPRAQAVGVWGRTGWTPRDAPPVTSTMGGLLDKAGLSTKAC